MSADDDLNGLFMHTVKVETYQGTGAYGDTWGPMSGDMPALVDHGRRLVRDERGSEVVSEATVRLPLSYADAVPPGSRVYLRARTATVISRKEWDGTALDLPSHVEVTLT